MSEPVSIASGIASRYATAIFELARADKKIKDLESDVNDLEMALKLSADLRSLVNSPLYTRDQVENAISSISQDMLSALFYARTFNKDSVKHKRSFFIPVFIDEENYSVEVVYLRNEKVKTNFGEINCMVFKPKMQEGRVFQDGEKMRLWISDDRNNLLVKVETQIWAGTIRAILRKCKEVKYPLSISK